MSSAYNESQARDLLKKADAKLTSFFGNLFGNKYEESLEMYNQAANLFKMAKNFKGILSFSCSSFYYYYYYYES